MFINLYIYRTADYNSVQEAYHNGAASVVAVLEVDSHSTDKISDEICTAIAAVNGTAACFGYSPSEYYLDILQGSLEDLLA